MTKPVAPALAITEVLIEAVVEYARNARTHTPQQVAQIAGSIREFGFVNPVLIGPDGVLVAGHGRVLAARSLGLKSVPAIHLPHLTKAQARALAIADNRIAQSAGWDEELLAAELAALRDEDGFDLELLGFHARELDQLLASADRDGSEDDTPDVPDVPTSQLGDLWILGDHRLLCGDSTKREDVARLLDGAKPHLMVTDPPYGVEFDPDQRNRARSRSRLVGRGRTVSEAQSKRTGKVANDERADWREVWRLFPGEVAYVWHDGMGAGHVAETLTAADFALRSQIIWRKQTFALGAGNYHWQHECCWYAVRKGSRGRWSGDRTQSTVWDIQTAVGRATYNLDFHSTHGTQKPVECMRRPMLNNSGRGDRVFEPFSGSGTTIIAGQSCGRIVLACEIDPLYVDQAVLRWEKFTGEKARLGRDGPTFDEVRAERVKEPEEA